MIKKIIRTIIVMAVVFQLLSCVFSGGALMPEVFDMMH